jgi:hypothetical protein
MQSLGKGVSDPDDTMTAVFSAVTSAVSVRVALSGCVGGTAESQAAASMANDSA